MKKIVSIKAVSIILATTFCMHAVAQQNSNFNGQSASVIAVKNGSFFYTAKTNDLRYGDIGGRLTQMLGLGNLYNFTKLYEKTDDLGFQQASYQQYYAGIKVENAIVLVHGKDNYVISINGKVASGINSPATASITQATALDNAKKDLQVVKTIKDYPVELVMVLDDLQKNYLLAYKVRIDGTIKKGLVMKHIYVDAQTGKIIKTINLINDIDKLGVGQTYYSGAQIFTVDSGSFGCRLRDSARKIITYDVAGTDLSYDSTDLFYNPRDYYNSSATWNASPNVTNITLTACPAANLSLLSSGANVLDVEGMVKRKVGPVTSVISWPEDPTAVLNPTLPIVAERMFVFPKDTLDIAAFGGLINVGNHYDFLNAVSFPINHLDAGTHYWSDNQGNKGNYTLKITKNPAVDAHWGMQKTLDFYSTVFKRKSYDGNGSLVRNYVNGVWRIQNTQDNAAALPEPYNAMIYGMGDGVMLDPVVGLDVMGHEFTHMVTRNNGNGGLQYQGESGAMNESFSDIFGTCVEFYSKGMAANWLIGEGVTLDAEALRSMSDPKQYQNPDTYHGQYWINTNSSFDNGGVHFNSGVQNKWFYLLSVGGTGVNDNGDAYTVTGIGIEKARKIAYRSLTTYLTPAATFMDAYVGSKNATLDLFGPDSTYQEFNSVCNAWYAVGIGDAYTLPVTTPPVTAINGVQVSNNDLKIYPNPATTKIIIESSIPQQIDAAIFSATGRLIKKITVSKGENAIDLSGIAKGVYVVRYETGGNGFVQKFTVQ